VRPRGYPERIDDGRLRGVREHLVWLLETTWHEVGCMLPSVKTEPQLRLALKAWEKRVEQEEHVVKALLRPTGKTATSTLLNRQRRQQDELHHRVLSAEKELAECWDSLHLFMQIPASDSDLPPAEQDVICEAVNERARRLAHAGNEYLSLSHREEELGRVVRDGEAYFARTELLRLCKSQRFTLNPLNVANGLAGLPFIGCRRSAKRCRDWPAQGLGGTSVQVFQIIQCIVQANARKPSLITDAENWLRTHRPTGSNGILELQQNWY